MPSLQSSPSFWVVAASGRVRKQLGQPSHIASEFSMTANQSWIPLLCNVDARPHGKLASLDIRSPARNGWLQLFDLQSHAVLVRLSSLEATGPRPYNSSAGTCVPPLSWRPLARGEPKVAGHSRRGVSCGAADHGSACAPGGSASACDLCGSVCQASA